MINAYLTQTITRSVEVKDAYGDITTTSTATIKGRLIWKTKIMKTESGEDISSPGFFLCLPAETITPGDRLTIGGRIYSALAVEEHQDFTQRMKKVILR